MDAKDWIPAFTSDPSRPSWEKRIGALGIERNEPIVLCDDGSNKDAAGVRAILRYWGFTDVRLLDGGWHAWLFAGGQRDAKAPHPTPRAVKLDPTAGEFIAKEQVLEMLRSGSVQVVDACTTVAADPSADLQAAVKNTDNSCLKRLTWVSIVAGRRSLKFSAKELEQLVRNAGIDVSRPTVVCSESLENAAGVAFALELIGARNVQICFPAWYPAAEPSLAAGN